MLTPPETYEQLVQLLDGDDKVKVAGIDVDGVLRGKIMSKEKFLGIVEGGEGFGFSSVVFGWDMHDAAYTKELLVGNNANGFRDLFARIDISTYRRLSWEYNIPLFLVHFVIPETGELLPVDPRSIMDKVTAKAKDMGGWRNMAGAELEYFQFAETPRSIAEKGFHNLTALTPGMHGYSMIRPTLNIDYFHALYDEAKAIGIEVEAHHTETGPGVYETALAYTDAAKMADNVTLFKLVAKSIGYKYGVLPTFMAKPYSDQSGCSGHIHVSLKGEDGRNAFALSKEEIKAGGRANAYHEHLRNVSEVAEYFLAGLIDGLQDVMPLFCPTINSYKRLAGGAAYWAPDTSSYGYDSRAASIRIIAPPGCPPSGTRFEVRIPGADMNAHYALAAIFGLGLRGIEKKLKLPYGPLGDGATRDTVKALPTTLEAAVNSFKRAGSVARELFGDYFVDHFAGTREHEIAVFQKAVTSWELERYFELV